MKKILIILFVLLNVVTFAQSTKVQVVSAVDYINKGKEDLKVKNIKDAYTYFSKAISIDNNNVEAYFLRGYLNLYYEYNYSSAISDFTKCIQLKPNYAEAYLYRGNSYRKSNEGFKAIKDFTKSTAINGNTDALFLRALEKSKLNDYYGAISDYDKIILL